MDYFTILAQSAEYKKKLKGARVDAVRLSGSSSLYISFDREPALKLSCTPGMPYVHELEKRYMPIRNAQNWHSTKIVGTTLKKVEITPGDRILTFVFNSRNRIIFEMTGRHTNIILVDRSGSIIGSMRKVTARQSGVRVISRSVPYEPPPPREYIDMLWSPLQILTRRFTEAESDISKALAGLCSGSALCAEEAIARAGLDGRESAAEIAPDDLLRLLKHAAEIAGASEKTGTGGTIIVGSDSLPRDVFPMKMVSAGEDARYIDDLSEAVRVYSLERELGLEWKQLSRSIETALAREEKSLRNTLVKVERERGKQSEPEELERLGNTLLASLYIVKKGMKSAILPDIYGEGEIEVTLDAKLDGPANADKYFTRSRKLKAAEKLAEERIAGLKKRLGKLHEEKDHFEAVDNLRELRKLASKHERKSSKNRAGEDFDQPFPRRFVSPSGLEIIVGRNDKENDALIRWAGKNDYWLHAQSVGGSHVILRTPGKKQNPDNRSVETAAAVAAYYSKSKTSAVVPVVCTDLKYVVKRRGQGPGKVTYTHEKVIFVEPGLPKQ